MILSAFIIHLFMLQRIDKHTVKFNLNHEKVSCQLSSMSMTKCSHPINHITERKGMQNVVMVKEHLNATILINITICLLV